MRRTRRGSVLMEMIVVFPIYLVLFAGLFMLGDMLVRAIWLTSADRVASYDVANPSGLASGWRVLLSETVDQFGRGGLNSRQDTLSWSPYSYYSDTSFKGPWAFCAGAKTSDRYRLLETVRGQLASADFLVSHASGERRVGGDGLGTLLQSGGRNRIESKAYDVGREFTYNYYTLRRQRYTAADLTKTYRAMPKKDHDDPRKHAGRLVDAAEDRRPSWKVGVAQEKWPEVGGGKETDSNRYGNRMPELHGREYTRYRQFEAWSD